MVKFYTARDGVHKLIAEFDGGTQNWIVSAEPYFIGSSPQYIEVQFSVPVSNSETTIAWTILAKDSTPVTALVTIPS